MNAKNRLITGVPRSGTTLCCHLLNQYSNTLALHEPLSPKDFNASKGREFACKKIEGFLAETRIAVAQQGVAVTRHRDGQVPDNIMAADGTSGNGTLRKAQISLGAIDVSARHLKPDFQLYVKHNALFTALLPELQHYFPVYAVLRNPLAVLISWNTVALPVNQGRLPAAEKYCGSLARLLNQEPRVLQRQLLILSWLFAQFKRFLPAEHLIFYEALVSDSDYLAQRLGLPLCSLSSHVSLKNSNAEKTCPDLTTIYNTLMAYQGGFWDFYTRSEVEALYQSIMSK